MNPARKKPSLLFSSAAQAASEGNGR
ncbi:acetylglucosamine transferase, partial [Neisseria gonorrhoeae]